MMLSRSSRASAGLKFLLSDDITK